MKVWVLDQVGYDQRGGQAQVFSTSDLAKAAVSYVKAWKQDADGDWTEITAPFDTAWVIQGKEVDA